MTLMIDTFALLALFVVAILRLNEAKLDSVRILLWAMTAAGAFGLGCDQIVRLRVLGPDLWEVMMHVGFAGLVVVRFVSYKARVPERRAFW